MDVILAQPRGFCAGVVRAVEIVEQALDVYGPPVYVLHEIVHNHYVVEELERKGAVFTELLDDIPSGALTIFSAHGVASGVMRKAEQRGLRILDATCPLVTKVHLQAQKYAKAGYEIVIIGHIGHPEVEGTRGRIEGSVHVLCSTAEVARLEVTDPKRIAYVTQTTLSTDDTREVLDALKQRFPGLKGPELTDICYATQNRQNAVRKLAREVELLLVVGAHNSSNSNRLREVGEISGCQAHLIQDAANLRAEWFHPDMRVGITAGASTPEILVNGVLERLRSFGECRIKEMEGVREVTTFRLPAALLKAAHSEAQMAKT